MSALLALAEPRRIKASHRRRRRCTTGHRQYANNNPYRFTDPTGREVANRREVANTCSRVGAVSCSGSFATGNEAGEIAAEIRKDFIGRQAAGAKVVADGASDIADFVDEQAVDTVKTVGIGRAFGLFRIVRNIFRSAKAAKGTAFGEKILQQLPKRGFTQEEVLSLIRNPSRTLATRDTRHLPGGAMLST